MSVKLTLCSQAEYDEALDRAKRAEAALAYHRAEFEKIMDRTAKDCLARVAEEEAKAEELKQVESTLRLENERLRSDRQGAWDSISTLRKGLDNAVDAEDEAAFWKESRTLHMEEAEDWKSLAMENERSVQQWIAKFDSLSQNQSAQVNDAARIEWLEDQARRSRTGISFDWVPSCEGERSGFRFMRRFFAGEPATTLRRAVDLARGAATAHRTDRAALTPAEDDKAQSGMGG